ncbi:heavy-metal-associated domain-containing protein [Flavobacterium sp. XGLA_31]|uniref:heavy-metal-associated domain-containing protein n=1 Tax=Flavobacterium sp. XGLA_31 TaxID=3447666 RepID=UPI003F35A81E
MNFTKSILAFGLAASLFVSCKDTASQPTAKASEETTDAASKTTAVATKPETASFRIDGMTCAIGCAKTIETKLSNMKGVQKATVDFDKKQATVDFDGAVLTPEKLVQAVESTGDGETYKVSDVKTGEKI